MIEKTYIEKLVDVCAQKGIDQQFARELGMYLKTDNARKRMIGYLLQVKNIRLEDVADEAIAIVEMNERFRQKKINEYNNQQYNNMLLHGLNKEEEE